MTEREASQMFLALYEHLHDQEQIVGETTIVVQAIYKALCEKFVDFDGLYAKHHKRLISESKDVCAMRN
jgi:hypothetical protein